MGFELQNQIFRFDFDESTKWPGLTIRIKEMEAGIMLDAMDLADGGQPTKEQLQSMFGILPELIVDWNIEKDGQPVPVNEQSVRKLGISLFMQIFTKVFDQALEIQPDLKAKSTGGLPSATGLSLPMEPR